MAHSQSEVWEYFDGVAREASTMGEYVLVNSNTGCKKACFGPDPEGEIPQHGWHVVAIDWENRHFIMAPPEDEEAED